MSDKVYVGSVISDVHVGAFRADILFNELDKEYLDYIRKQPILDYIIIDGDLNDGRISLNSEHAKYLMMFMKELKKICIEKNTKIRAVKGTESHDNKQLEILKFMFEGDIDFKIINTVSSEYLFDDFKVLYIPEEYVEDIDEYYKSFFIKDEYDMIFGHGMVGEVTFHAKRQESEPTMTKAPIFKSETLIECSKGPIFFGHIHTSQIIRKRFYYVGSFSRWCFGEEEDKGFYMVSYTPETSSYKAEFIKNKLARRYDTISIECNNSIFNDELSEQIKYLKQIVNTLGEDFIRLAINVPENYENDKLFTNTVNEVFSKYKNVKLKIINDTKARKEKKIEETVNLLLDKYSFLFEKSISEEEKIFKFIQEKYNKNIPIDRIRKYLFNKTNN